MKKLLIHAFALLTALLPLQMAEAAPKPPAIFGGFAVGKTFTLRVTDVSSYTNQGGTNVAVPIPNGVPVFALGQEVTFTIGNKGELTAPKVKIPFVSDGGSANVYSGKPKKGTASVFKSLTTGEPLNTNLDFVVAKGGRTGLNITWVSYKFNP